MKITPAQLRELIKEEAKSLAGSPKESLKDYGVSSKVANLAKGGKLGAGFSPLKGKNKTLSRVDGYELMKGAEGLVSMKTLKEQRALGIDPEHELGKVVKSRLSESGEFTFDVQFGDRIVKGIPADRLLILK